MGPNNGLGRRLARGIMAFPVSNSQTRDSPGKMDGAGLAQYALQQRKIYNLAISESL
jgi:hypothetical protein